jgi:hypothetical protein
MGECQEYEIRAGREYFENIFRNYPQRTSLCEHQSLCAFIGTGFSVPLII